jgi:hypothetical protein
MNTHCRHVSHPGFELIYITNIVWWQGEISAGDSGASGAVAVRWGDEGASSRDGFDPGFAARKLLVLDVIDHIDLASRDWVTFDDAGNVVREDAAEARAAALGLRFEAWLGSFARNSDQMRLLRMMEQQVRANAADIQT